MKRVTAGKPCLRQSFVGGPADSFPDPPEEVEHGERSSEVLVWRAVSSQSLPFGIKWRGTV